MGAIAAVLEAIVGYYDGAVHLLPALPQQWKDGHLYGVKVPGGHRVNVAWENGVLTKLSVTMGYQNSVTLYYNGETFQATGAPGETVSLRS